MADYPVVELQPQDDLASLRRRLGEQDGGRVILVLPWNLRLLSRVLDYDLLWREAERWQLEIAVVSTDPERRQVARASGFPAFGSIGEAQKTKWRSHPPEQVQPPPSHWWDGQIDLRPRPVHRRLRWLHWIGVGIRCVIFLLAVLVVAASAYVIVPSSVVTLVPAGREFVAIVPVSVVVPEADETEAGQVDLVKGVIPARNVGDEFEGHAEVETSGEMSVVAGRAAGTVLFTNLLLQDYLVPVGTVVRTSSTSYPFRFRTTTDVVVPAGGQVTAPVEAIDEGVGNVGAFQINMVEGVVGSVIRVINPEPTTGAEANEARVVTQADYDRLRSLLMQQLLAQSYAALNSNGYLQPTEMLLRQSLSIQAVPKQAYNRFISEQSDTVGLDMSVLVSGVAVDVDNAEAVAYAALVRRLPPGYQLVNAHFELGEVAEEDIGPGNYTLFVTAHGYAAVALDANAAIALVRGQRLADARERLAAEFPLAEAPRITLWPVWPEQFKWLERMPLLPLRIQMNVIPQGQSASQASLGAR